MRSALVLAVLASPSAYAGSASEDFATVGTVELTDTVSVPLQRGVDTKGITAVFASGPKGDGSDEFLLTLNLAAGPSQCTEAVVGALGGTKKDVVLARYGKLFRKVKKVTATLAEVPELRIGGLTIKNFRCEIHKEENSLAIPSLVGAAVAVLPSQGVVKFAPSSQADALLSSVGTPIPAQTFALNTFWVHDAKQARLGNALVLPVTLLGKPAKVWLAPHRPSSLVNQSFVGEEATWSRSGAPYLHGAASVGEVPLAPATFVVSDEPLVYRRDSDGENSEINAVLGADVLYATDIAIDPAGRVAVAAAPKVLWSNPGIRILEEKKKAFEGPPKGEESASILIPLPDGGPVFVGGRAPASEAYCERVAVVDQPTFAYVEGVRSFGAKARTVSTVEVCSDGPDTEAEPVAKTARSRREEPAPAQAGASGGATSEPSEPALGNKPAGKEATRQSDWGDALWSQGRYDEAYAAFTAGLPDAGDDCSFYVDYAEKSLRMGKLDAAVSAASRAAELYEAYMKNDLEVRLRTEQKKTEAGDPTLVQAHDCHKARGLQAQVALARAEHARVDSLYEQHMDLDQDLAFVAALARVQRGWADSAQGLVLQALNVGGRGQRPVYTTAALIAARTGNARLLNANLDRLFELDNAWTLSDAVFVASVARESGGTSASLALTRRIAQENPSSSSAWAAYGLEALRAGDAEAQAQVRAAAAKITSAELSREAGTANAWCRAGALHAVTGDSAGAELAWKEAQAAAGRGMDCVTARAVAAAAAGDAGAVASYLGDLGTRFPAHPLGTLGALSAVAPR
jgi:tetratricopeptide (TPR) repeat protein